MTRNRSANKKVRRPRQNSRKPNGPRGSSSANGPSQFSANVRLNHRYRFTATAAQNGAITDTNLLGICGGVGTVVNTSVSLFTKSVRIKKIEIWSAPAAQGSNSTCSVDWEGFGNSPNIEISDTTLSVTKNAHIATSPPPQSLCAFWQQATGTNLFTIVCPANSIIDIWVDQILEDLTGNSPQVGAATVALTHIYYFALDGPGTHNLVPVALNTTF